MNAKAQIGDFIKSTIFDVYGLRNERAKKIVDIVNIMDISALTEYELDDGTIVRDWQIGPKNVIKSVA